MQQQQQQPAVVPPVTNMNSSSSSSSNSNNTNNSNTSSITKQQPNSDRNNNNKTGESAEKLTLMVAKMYLQSFQRQPVPTITGLLYYGEDNNYNNYNNVDQQQQSVNELKETKTDNDINNHNSSIETIKDAFDKCKGLRPTITTNVIPRTTTTTATKSLSTTTLSSTIDLNNYHKVIQRLKIQEQQNKYIDCLSYMTCPKLFSIYSQCWLRNIHAIMNHQLHQLQQQQKYNNKYNITKINQQQQQQTNTSSNNNNNNKELEQLNLLYTEWKYLKENGMLSHLCLKERETLERCIGIRVMNANR